MEGNFHITIQGIETKIDNVPVKIGEITISGYGKRSRFETLLGILFLKDLPSWMKKMTKAAVEMSEIQ